MLACTCLSAVMPAHSASKTRVNALTLAGIHVLFGALKEDVDARHKAGHDECGTVLP
jgi:hypothetical protein